MAHFVNDFDLQARLAESLKLLHEKLDKHFIGVHQRFDYLDGKVDAIPADLPAKTVDTKPADKK